MFFLSLLIFLINAHAVSGDVFSSSSQLGEYYNPSLALDGNDKTSWCADKTTVDSGKITLFREMFDDWWQVEFDKPRTIGSIYMKSGLYYQNRLYGHRIRDFVWAYQRDGSSEWNKIPETDIYANRYQLIFRFNPISNIKKIRLLSRTRDPYEITLGGWDPNKPWGSNNPCLREVRFYSDKNAVIKTDPWFYTVNIRENYHTYLSLNDKFGSMIDKLITEITGKRYADITSPLWIGDFHTERIKGIVNGSGQLPGYNDKSSKRGVIIGNEKKSLDEIPISNSYSEWVLHEPVPAGFLLGGSYLHYKDRSPALMSGFYHFFKENYMNYPMLGACGGHQVLAMAVVNDNYEDFAREFKPYSDSLEQVVVSCGTVYGCPDHSCCQEVGNIKIIPNINGKAMTNIFSSKRYDMLFNFLDRKGGFKTDLGHSDYVNPERIKDFFDIIATYPKDVKEINKDNFCLVQAVKLKGLPFYGTQFHWNTFDIRNDCNKPFRKDKESLRNMERVLKNFILIAMNQLNDRNLKNIIPSSTSTGSVENLYDLDKNSMWCSDERGPYLTFKFNNAITLRYIIAVEGETSLKNRPALFGFSYSNDEINWINIPFSRTSAYYIQKESDSAITECTCDTGGDKLSGADDYQTMLISFDSPVTAKYFRINMTSYPNHDSCLREIFMLALNGEGGSLDIPMQISPKGIITDRTPTFEWEPVEGANKYQVWISHKETPNEYIYLKSTTFTSLNLADNEALNENEEYRWFVRALYNPLTPLEWSEGMDFTVDTEICNNKDDDGDSEIDEGCDDDRDTFWDSQKECEGKYLAGNDISYDCKPEWTDLDDTNSKIGSEKCNNRDDDLDGKIDDGCDDDKDTWWDEDMICEGKYLAGNGVVYDCKPEWSDGDDDDPSIEHDEICNNHDDDGDGVIDNGCDDDGDTWWNSGMSCKGNYLAGNCVIYDCKPEWSDCNDNDPNIKHLEHIEADLKHDCKIDIYDLTIVTTRLGLTNSDSGWNATMDVVQNGEIDIYDIVFVASRFS